MSKALDFLNQNLLSMECVLIVLNCFLQETNSSKIALDVSLTEQLCEPLKDYVDP